MLSLLKRSPEYDDDETWPSSSFRKRDMLQQVLDRNLIQGLEILELNIKRIQSMLDNSEKALRKATSERDIDMISSYRSQFRDEERQFRILKKWRQRLLMQMPCPQSTLDVGDSDSDAARIVELESLFQEFDGFAFRHFYDIQGASVVDKVMAVERNLDNLIVAKDNNEITAAEYIQRQSILASLLSLLKRSPEYDDDKTWPIASIFGMQDVIQESLDSDLIEGLNSIDRYTKNAQDMLDICQKELRDG
jgi:hypothetical protein